MNGHTFLAPGHVREVLLNHTTGGAVRVRCGAPASVRDTRYDVKCVVDKQNQQVWFGIINDSTV